MGESPYYLEIREMIQYKYMEEEDHFTQTQLPALFVALVVAAIAAPLSLLFSLLHSQLSALTHLTLFSCCLFIGKNGGCINGLVPSINGCLHLSMVGATIIDNGTLSCCCPIMAITQQSPPLPFIWGNCPLASSA